MLAQLVNVSTPEMIFHYKYDVIQMFEREPGKIGVIFKCGKTQNKVNIKDTYEYNSRSDVCQVQKRNQASKYVDVNLALYEWYMIATSKSIHPNSTQLSEKAKQIAQHLGYSDFKASHGWLDK